MDNDSVYRSFTKDELVQRCIDLGNNRVAMLKERSRLRAELAKCRAALEQILAPFEDLNFVSANKLLTYIHDTAAAALAAKEEPK